MSDCVGEVDHPQTIFYLEIAEQGSEGSWRRENQEPIFEGKNRELHGWLQKKAQKHQPGIIKK